MASIQKWNGNRYRAHWRDQNGRPQSKVFRRKIDADLFLKKVSADLVRGEYVSPKLASSPFDEWADKWWATTPKLATSTRRGYWKLLENHVRPHFGGMPLDRIDWDEVERFVAIKTDAGLSPKKIRDMVSVVSLIMKTAIRSKARGDNPATGHTIKQRRQKVRQGDVLTMEEAHRLVAATRDPYKPAVWLMVLLGLRPAELCGLRVRSVDFGRGTVHVSETLNAVHSFPGHEYRLEVGPPKTDAGDRVLPIPDWLREDLAAVLAARAERRGAPIEPAEHLFLAIKGAGPIRVADLRRWVVRPALKEAGLPVEFRTYDLRHTHASLLIDLGANPLEIAHRMGHRPDRDPTGLRALV